MKLTKFLRLNVYSYFSFEETFHTLSCLSRRDRQDLQKSYIARENKQLCLDIKSYNLLGTLLVQGQIDEMYERIKIALSLAGKIKLEISGDLENETGLKIGKQLAGLLHIIPERFDNKSVTIQAYSNSIRHSCVDNLLKEISKQKSNMVLEHVYLSGSHNISSHASEFLLNKVGSLTLDTNFFPF